MEENKKIEELEKKIEKLSSQSNLKFFFQVILIPIIVSLITALVTISINKSKLDFDKEYKKIEYTNECISGFFDESPAKTMAYLNLLEYVSNKDKIYLNLKLIVLDYYLEQLINAQKKNDLDKYSQIYSILKKTKELDDTLSLIEKNSFITESKIDSVKEYERLGFEFLVKEDLEKAKENFRKAEKISPTYHCVSEINKYLNSTKNQTANYKTIISVIIDKYSWKAPEDILEQLKIKADN